MRRKYRCQSKSAVDVSIHAPVKGATEGFDAVNTGSGFNSRTRKGCDLECGEVTNETTLVSIHAPVKGATRYRNQSTSDYSGFNSRTRKGCDVHLTTVDHDEPVSIHAPVKGATPESVRNHHAEIRFNSRTRKGCDSELFYRDEER